MKNDLGRFYALIEEQQSKMNGFYKRVDGEGNEVIFKMLDIAKLEDTKENRLALIQRLVNLRDENLIEALRQHEKSPKEIIAIRHKLYDFVASYHLKLQKKTIKRLEKERVLSPFYMELVKGVYRVGKALSFIQPLWQKHIIEDINVNLEKEHGDDVYEFLSKQNLLELNVDKSVADRSYSALVKTKKGYKSKAYIKVFKELKLVSKELNRLIKNLKKCKDNEFGQKKAYINYFKAIKKAFCQKDKLKLISSWQKVDEAWMKVTCPIQVGHPLEYYEDHLRKAVAFEWDIRLSDAKRAKKTRVKDDILSMYKALHEKIGKKPKVYKKCTSNVSRVGLYLGRPAFYFAAEFNGLFSAQVVPNDEMVSKKYGKKIFAFADNIYEAAKARPFLRLEKEVFGQEFLDKSREILFKNKPLWHEVYEVSTIGHEYGHILWLDTDSEAVMNKSGMFKNIEEFKATTGGLMAFFYNEQEYLKEPLMIDLIKRSVGLLAWQKTKEVEPYYCEGLIHLKALFETKVLDFKKSLNIDLSPQAYKRLKKWYVKNYEILARHYLDKRDAKEFLDKFARVDREGYFMPIDDEVKYFVNYYIGLHSQIGRSIDENDNKNKWL